MAGEWNIYGLRVFLFFIFQLVLRISSTFAIMTDEKNRKRIIALDITLSIVSFILAFRQFAAYYVAGLSGSFTISSIMA